MILFYWHAELTTAVAPRRKEGVAAVQATRRCKEGPWGRTGGGGGRSECKKVSYLLFTRYYFIGLMN
jgi:hypothetical protein